MATGKQRPDDSAPQETKAARTRRRIIDAAARVLSDHGYAGTRLSDIADEADLQAAAIYYHFGSREELVEAVVGEGTAQVVRHVRQSLEALPSGASPMERIVAAVDAHLRVTLGLSVYTTAAVRNSGQLPEHMRERQRIEEDQYGALWRGMLEEARARGEIRADADLVLARMLVLGALNWAAEWWHPERDSVETVIGTAQTLIRRGLEVRGDLAPMPLFLAPEL